MYTGTLPGVSPAIRAGKGWRGRRELAPQVFCHPIRCMHRRRVWRDTHVVHKVRTTTTTTTTTTTSTTTTTTTTTITTRGGRRSCRRLPPFPRCSSWLWTSLCSCSDIRGGLFGALLGLTVDTCTATAWSCFWTYFTHFLRADGDSGPGVDSRPALPAQHLVRQWTLVLRQFLGFFFFERISIFTSW